MRKSLGLLIVLILVSASIAGCISSNKKKGGGDDKTSVVNQPPTALFTISSTGMLVGNEIVFDPAGSNDTDGNITTYHFDFGDSMTMDGNTSAPAFHFYSVSGLYSVTLTVTDDDGNVSEPYTMELEIKDIINQLLLYDPTGQNLKTTSRSLNGTVAYLVEIKNGAYGDAMPVSMDPAVFTNGLDKDKPLAINGSFDVLDSGGNRTIKSIVKSSLDKVDNMDFSGAEYQNVELQVTSVSIVAMNHTFGFGYTGTGEPIAYVSLDKKPTFFTDVKIRGVIVPKTIFSAMDILLADFEGEYGRYIDAFKQFSNSTVSGFELGLNVMVADSIEYVDAKPFRCDVIDIITPTDVSNFLETVLDEGVDGNNTDFLGKILDELNMELIFAAPPKITAKALDLWFIIGVTDLARSEAVGPVTLNIVEITADKINKELGTQIPAVNPGDKSLKTHFAVCGDRDLENDVPETEVQKYWDMLEKPLETNTSVGGVTSSVFAMVMSLEDVMTYMEDLFQTDMSTLKSLTSVRNPGVGLLIDGNFTEVFDSDKPFYKYLALGLFPDIQLDRKEQLMYSLKLSGTVYNLGKFLDNGEYKFPVVITDVIEKGPTPTKYGLDEIFNGALGNATFKAISTEGFATGTTMKTVAEYAQYFPPAAPTANLILKSPIDVDAYAMFQPANNGNRYHTSVIGFNLTKDNGPTYFMQKVQIEGFFVNLSKFAERFDDVSGLGDNLGVSSLIREIVDTVGDLTGDRILTGTIVAYKIVPVSAAPEIAVTELHCYSSFNNGTKASVLIKGKVMNKGTGQLLPVARIIITPEKGARVFYTASLAMTDTWEAIPSVYLPSGGTASFKYETTFPDSDFLLGKYQVDVYIMEWTSGLGIENKLGEAHGNFTVFTSPYSVGYTFIYDNAINNIIDYKVFINISIASSVATVTGNPVVYYWSDLLFIPVTPTQVTMTKDLNDVWYLDGNWPITDNFKYYITFKVSMNGEEYEVITPVYSV